MGLISAKEEVLDVEQGNRARRFSASPEEGRRLIWVFLRIELSRSAREDIQIRSGDVEGAGGDFSR